MIGRGLVGEPLVHLAVAGGLVWLAAGALERPVVRVDGERIAEVRASAEAALGRPPDALELREALLASVDRELLARDGFALGLDQGDPVVRRRVIQKMELLLERSATPPPPPDAVLEAWLADHAEAFRVPERIGLAQVFYDRERRPDAEADARRGAEPGDPFLHGARFPPRPIAAYGALFGTDFAEALAAVAGGPGTTAVVASRYGWHRLEITEREAARIPALPEARGEVLEAWTAAERERGLAAEREARRARYRVVGLP